MVMVLGEEKDAKEDFWSSSINISGLDRHVSFAGTHIDFNNVASGDGKANVQHGH